MNAVHLWRDHGPSQYAVDYPRQADVAVIEHRGGIKQHLEYENAEGGGSENGNNRELDRHRKDDLDRMKAQTGRDIKLQVRMVHPMQPPERRHGVEDPVLEIDRKIEQNNRE